VFIVATKIVNTERRASAIGTVTIGYNAALILGLPIGRVIASLFGWKTIFWILAMFCVLSILLVYKYIPKFDVEEPTPFKNQLKAIKNNKIVVSMSISFFWILGYATFYTFVTPFLQQVASIDNQLLSASLLAFGIATLIGNKLGGYLGDRFGISKTILISMILNAFSLILISTITNTPIISIVILMIWALAAWAPGPLLRYNIISLTNEEPGVILSLYNSLIQVGVAVGAGLGGLVINHLPISFLSYIAAIFVIVSALLANLFTRINLKTKHIK